jgi:3-isopropylmalate dehydrogenase
LPRLKINDCGGFFMNIAVIKGDGIGPEVVGEALKILGKVASKYGHKFNYSEALLGGGAYDATGKPLPEETVKICLKSDAVLLGAVGGPKWDNLPGHLRPEAALLGIRKALKLYANIRPAVLYPALSGSCPLKADIVAGGVNIAVVRELTGGIYFGEKGRRTGVWGEEAYDTDCYSVFEVERIARVAFNMARKRKKQVISIDKANVLESSRLWRETVHELAEKEYPDIEVTDMLVDNAAMQLVRDPSQFDVILADNMFGDILSDEAAMVTGSIGILPSSSVGDGKRGLYEPIHGSAPDIAGQNKANPIATILSAAMMLRNSFDLEEEAAAVEKAVSSALEKGYATSDLNDNNYISCNEMGDKIAEEI